MKAIKILFFILVLINIICFSMSQLNGKCGYPGKPYRAKLEPDNKLQYLEGEEVTYQCTDFRSNVQTRRCERGRWTGKLPRCGDFVSGIQMKDVRVEDISTPDKPILMFEYLDMNLTNTIEKYPNAFTSSRFKKARLRIFDSKKYRWTFRFTAPFHKLFVRINFNFINTHLAAEQKQNFTFNISVFVSPERNCVLNHQNDDIWRQNEGKTDSYFTCDSISFDAYKRNIKNPGDYMIMETQSSVDLSHDLIAIIFGKSYGTPEEPLCGEPEVAISHFMRFNQQYIYYIIDCKSEKTWLYVSKQNDVIPGSTIHGFNCVGDMLWNGSYPECIPRKPCPLDKLLIGPNSNQTVINSMDGLYFFNETEYYAYEGTQAHYGCLNPGSDILVGKDSRICFKNGTWSSGEPYCYDPNETGKFPLLFLIGILGGTLTFVIILTAILFYVYTKRVKSKIVEQITNQRRPESGEIETYDDIDVPSDLRGKYDIYDTYDVIEEEQEVRYAEPYNTTEQDPYDDSHYVRMPRNAQIQSRDEYSQIFPLESDYLEMNVTPKPIPSPRKSLDKYAKYKT